MHLWGDVTLQKDSNGVEYLQLNERQTKTRTGDIVSDIQKVRHTVWATSDPQRCPVNMYKLYAIKRPEEFLNPEDPFNLDPRTISATNEDYKWFTKNRVGDKKLGKLLKSMCKEAGLDKNKKLTNTEDISLKT
ncbi:uncharacterized protein LOC127837711 [Dreissena polymorpha]|uniref:uncharacterized protein LOC127837711 n=1 Tax=Dreissena polymorpha TaxID=45954 RepID=UPI002265104F|nr:uncharacterized protein LOC127837711 [Dreissena polymorpha]